MLGQDGVNDALREAANMSLEDVSSCMRNRTYPLFGIHPLEPLGPPIKGPEPKSGDQGHKQSVP